MVRYLLFLMKNKVQLRQEQLFEIIYEFLNPYRNSIS